MASPVDQRRAEFNAFIWDHASDAFQAKFDKCAALDDAAIQSLSSLLTPDNLNNVTLLSGAVREAISANRDLVCLLLQIVGLTRNKIIQDIKPIVRLGQLRSVSVSTPQALFNSRQGARLASEYLARQLIRVFGHTKGHITSRVLEAINQATWPGYIRQERAKRMGHEAEYRLACLLKDCGIPFAPEEKVDNPMCRDVTIDDMSYDLVSPSVTLALMRVVSTVHTANIGQYGESKDDLEIRKAVESMRHREDRERITLLAFIDGVGFESNTAGLNGVLTNADEFCQFRTIWKAAAIAASKAKRTSRVAIPSPQLSLFGDFASRYNVTLVPRETLPDAPEDWVAAGDGFIQID